MSFLSNFPCLEEDICKKARDPFGFFHLDYADKSHLANNIKDLFGHTTVELSDVKFYNLSSTLSNCGGSFNSSISEHEPVFRNISSLKGNIFGCSSLKKHSNSLECNQLGKHPSSEDFKPPVFAGIWKNVNSTDSTFGSPTSHIKLNNSVGPKKSLSPIFSNVASSESFTNVCFQKELAISNLAKAKDTGTKEQIQNTFSSTSCSRILGKDEGKNNSTHAVQEHSSRVEIFSGCAGHPNCSTLQNPGLQDNYNNISHCQDDAETEDKYHIHSNKDIQREVGSKTIQFNELPVGKLSSDDPIEKTITFPFSRHSNIEEMQCASKIEDYCQAVTSVAPCVLPQSTSSLNTSTYSNMCTFNKIDLSSKKPISDNLANSPSADSTVLPSSSTNDKYPCEYSVLPVTKSCYVKLKRMNIFDWKKGSRNISVKNSKNSLSRAKITQRKSELKKKHSKHNFACAKLSNSKSSKCCTINFSEELESNNQNEQTDCQKKKVKYNSKMEESLSISPSVKGTSGDLCNSGMMPNAPLISSNCAVLQKIDEHDLSSEFDKNYSKKGASLKKHFANIAQETPESQSLSSFQIKSNSESFGRNESTEKLTCDTPDTIMSKTKDIFLHWQKTFSKKSITESDECSDSNERNFSVSVPLSELNPLDESKKDYCKAACIKSNERNSPSSELSCKLVKPCFVKLIPFAKEISTSEVKEKSTAAPMNSINKKGDETVISVPDETIQKLVILKSDTLADFESAQGKADGKPLSVIQESIVESISTQEIEEGKIPTVMNKSSTTLSMEPPAKILKEQYHSILDKNTTKSKGDGQNSANQKFHLEKDSNFICGTTMTDKEKVNETIELDLSFVDEKERVLLGVSDDEFNESDQSNSKWSTSGTCGKSSSTPISTIKNPLFLNQPDSSLSTSFNKFKKVESSKTLSPEVCKAEDVNQGTDCNAQSLINVMDGNHVEVPGGSNTTNCLSHSSLAKVKVDKAGLTYPRSAVEKSITAVHSNLETSVAENNFTFKSTSLPNNKLEMLPNKSGIVSSELFDENLKVNQRNDTASSSGLGLRANNSIPQKSPQLTKAESHSCDSFLESILQSSPTANIKRKGGSGDLANLRPELRKRLKIDDPVDEQKSKPPDSLENLEVEAPTCSDISERRGNVRNRIEPPLPDIIPNDTDEAEKKKYNEQFVSSDPRENMDNDVSINQ